MARISLDDRDPDMKATIYTDFGGSEVLPVLDVDFRDATLGIERDRLMNKSINMRDRNEEMVSYETPYERERRERELKLYNEYVTLTGDEGNSKTMVMKSLIKKYGYHAISTGYRIINRINKERQKG